MACDPNTLLTNARCIEECLMAGQLSAIETHLWCVIQSGGGVGSCIQTEIPECISDELGGNLMTE